MCLAHCLASTSFATTILHIQLLLARRAQAPDPDKVMTPDDEQYRRSILARSRNYLLSYALRNHEWVLWLDVDIVWVRFD